MSTLAANNAFHPMDAVSQSPPKSSSPLTPTNQFNPQQQTITGRSFINLNADIRSQTSFPHTPTSSSSSGVLDSPPGTPFADYLKTWTDSHTARWLADFKCAHHAERFKAHDIRGDILLELDQIVLKEMGVSSIGDRLKILNAVKKLRERASNRSPATPSIAPPRTNDSVSNTESRTQASSHSRPAFRRPAPLRLNGNHVSDLPGVVRETPDSARSNVSAGIRPLPQQPLGSASTSSNTPGGAHTPSHLRANLPPLPPPPRGQPPPPPGRPSARSGHNNNNWASTPTQSDPPPYTLPPPPSQQQNNQLLPPPSNWSNSHHTPADSRPGNPGGKYPPRSTSPLSNRGIRSNLSNPVHGRNGSGSLVSPSPSTASTNKLPARPSTTGTAVHPYANPQVTSSGLQPPSNYALHSLSPIDETFNAPGSPSPPSLAYNPARPAFAHSSNSSSGGSQQLTLDDIRRKIVRFVMPNEGLTYTIDVTACSSGIEVLERVLKKFGKSNSKHGDGEAPLEHALTYQGGLTVDGWGVYRDVVSQDNPGEPLTEAELMSICHAPDHPSREHGLVLCKTKPPRRTESPLNSGGPTSKITKRASSISILSSLGVPNPERALDHPPSPTSPTSLRSPAMLSASAKRPSKLRNFFGHRPPSELITTHLPEYFPNTEKKILERTARHSMMLKAKRDSYASMSSNPPLPSRFSVSTRESSSPSRVSLLSNPSSVVAERLEAVGANEDIPRMSLSTDDGQAIDLQPEVLSASGSGGQGKEHLLPPIPFPGESFSQSIEDATKRRVSRALSTTSRRMSYMTELRSKRDRSDTASLMTVDEITAEVESRRASSQAGIVDAEGKLVVADAPVDAEAVVAAEEEEEETELSEESDDGGVTLNGDDDDIPKEVEPIKFKSNKWIKGALIGSGSFGKVYLGMDASNGLLMAVKQVELATDSLPNPERKRSMLNALEREIELLKNLQHKNIVQYLYSSLDDEYLNIFLEYVPGGSVATLLRNYGAFEETLVKNFVKQILSGLSYLHERDIIHRDIKGANILVDNKGGVKISDFGISKKVNDNLLAKANRMHRFSLQGSVFWMAPEVVKQSGHTLKADIWSVGCLVVEMLTGEHPWADLTQMQAIFKIGSLAKPAMPSDISVEAQEFLAKTFELDQNMRPSAKELQQHPFVAVKKK